LKMTASLEQSKMSWRANMAVKVRGLATSLETFLHLVN